MIGALLLALAVQGSTGAAAPASASEPTVMIVEFPRGASMIGLPRRCPGASEEEDPGICLAELYQGWARVVRHLSGPRIRERELLRLTAHARRWPAGTRMLVATRPFDDQGTKGNFALWWALPLDGDDYCLDTETLARWGEDPVAREFASGHARRFRPDGYLERTDFRCIRG